MAQLISPYGYYKKQPSYSQYDFYDVHMADDVFGADTDLVSGVPQNIIIPLPYEIDPDEAIVLKARHVLITDNAFNQMLETALAEGELFRISDFYFKGDEVVETSPSYEDEQKEALGFTDLFNLAPVLDTVNGAGFTGRYCTEAILEYGNPTSFPLNIAQKLSLVDITNGIDIFRSPEQWYQKFYYRVGRNQLDALERVILLLRQEL